MRFPTASENEPTERSDAGVNRLAWLLAAVLTISIGIPLVAGLLLRYVAY
jgi:uncharacterized membrane protein YphA (DoxX/SURF4 family)